MGNEWQTVSSAKDKRKRAEAKVKPSANAGSSGLPFDPASAALAKLDADWDKQQRDGAQAQQNGKARLLGVNGSSISATGGSFVGLEVDDSPPDTPSAYGKAGGSTEDESKASDEPQIRKAAKPKKPRVKKVTTAQVAAAMSPDDLATLFESVEQKYKTDERNQLEIITDHFLSTFRECDIPFNKTVLEQPLSKSVNVPVQDVPEAVVSQVVAFLAKKDVQALTDFTATLVAAVFSDVPEADPSKIAPPKAKVGLLVVLCLILRTRPEVLLLLSPTLLSNAPSYSSRRRLAFQLWIIHQVTRSNVAVAVAVWCRVLLPQLLGQQLPSLAAHKQATASAVHKLVPSCVNAALTYMSEALAMARGDASSIGVQRLGPEDGDPKGLWALKAADTYLLRAAQEGIAVEVDGKSVVEPIVPLGAVEAIARAGFAAEPAFGPAHTRIRLLQHYEELRELHLAAVAGGVTRAQDAVRLALDLAAASAELPPPAGQVDEVVEQAARTMVDMVHVEPSSTASAWESRHKAQIRGSAAVLQSLKSRPHNLEQLLLNSHRRTLFLAMLWELRQRHKGLLANGKNWQQSSARAAEQACSTLASSTVKSRRNNAVANVFLLGTSFALTLVFLSRQDFAQDLWRTELGYKVAQTLQPPLDWLEATTAAVSQTAGGLVGPLYRDRIHPIAAHIQTWSAAEIDEKIKPLLQQLSSQLEPLLHSVSAKAAAVVGAAHNAS